MDLRIKYLTTNVEDIMEDMLKYHTNNEKINFLLDTKSYLATIATKLESEIISPLTHYEELFKMLPEKNEGADIILRALCSSVRTMAGDREKVGFTDTEVYADNLLKEQIPKQAKELRAVMRFIDEQVEILEKRVSNDTKRGNYNEKKEINNNTNDKLKPFFDDRMIFQQLEKLPENKKLNFINSTLAAINKFFNNKDFFELPIHIRLLVKQLEAQKLIYENLDSTEQKNHPDNYSIFDFDFEKIKMYAKQLTDDEKYKYYTRVQVELKRVLNSFANTEFKNFDGNIYAGTKEFKESINHILEKEKCSELNLLVEQHISNLNSNAGEKEFGIALMGIEIQLMKGENRLKKVKELIEYEVEYLEKILGKASIKKEKALVSKYEVNIEKERWAGTKTEFARKIAAEYLADKGKNYKSLKNACEQLFQKYEFDDKKFTAQRCYDLARKV